MDIVHQPARRQWDGDAFARLTEVLAAIDPARVADDGRHLPLIVIVGAPRSGTTLVHQALAHAGDAAYVSNIAARFAACAPLGALLHDAMGVAAPFTGRSLHGATSDPAEPHEFGRFWEMLFGVDSLEEPAAPHPPGEEDWKPLDHLMGAFGRPLLVKSFGYLWHVAALAARYPAASFVHVQRDAAANAASLARLYRARSGPGGPPLWTSAVTRATIDRWSGADLDQRCLAQVNDLNQRIRRDLGDIDASRSVSITLEAFLADPPGALATIGDAVGMAVDPQRAAHVGTVLAAQAAAR